MQVKIKRKNALENKGKLQSDQLVKIVLQYIKDYPVQTGLSPFESILKKQTQEAIQKLLVLKQSKKLGDGFGQAVQDNQKELVERDLRHRMLEALVKELSPEEMKAIKDARDSTIFSTPIAIYLRDNEQYQKIYTEFIKKFDQLAAPPSISGEAPVAAPVDDSDLLDINLDKDKSSQEERPVDSTGAPMSPNPPLPPPYPPGGVLPRQQGLTVRTGSAQKTPKTSANKPPPINADDLTKGLKGLKKPQEKGTSAEPDSEFLAKLQKRQQAMNPDAPGKGAQDGEKDWK